MSEEMKVAICGLLKVFETIAKQTKNPIDDIVIRALIAVLGCK